jgi:hypothetical protein
MKYWLCSADGETADVLLHVMAEETVKGAPYRISSMLHVSHVATSSRVLWHSLL